MGTYIKLGGKDYKMVESAPNKRLARAIADKIRSGNWRHNYRAKSVRVAKIPKEGGSSGYGVFIR